MQISSQSFAIVSRTGVFFSISCLSLLLFIHPVLSEDAAQLKEIDNLKDTHIDSGHVVRNVFSGLTSSWSVWSQAVTTYYNLSSSICYIDCC